MTEYVADQCSMFVRFHHCIGHCQFGDFYTHKKTDSMNVSVAFQSNIPENTPFLIYLPLTRNVSFVSVLIWPLLAYNVYTPASAMLISRIIIVIARLLFCTSTLRFASGTGSIVHGLSLPLASRNINVSSGGFDVYSNVQVISFSSELTSKSYLPNDSVTSINVSSGSVMQMEAMKSSLHPDINWQWVTEIMCNGSEMYR